MFKFANSKKLVAIFLMICLVFTMSGCTTVETDADGNYIRDEDSACAKIVGVILTFFQSVLGKIGLENYTYSIILLTLVVILFTTPLNIKQQKSMKAMQEVGPKMQEINVKYADNPQKRQEETAKIYREGGVNPMAGCLPLLIQMPILFVLFIGMRNWLPDQAFIDAGLYSFFWIDDLSLTVSNTSYQWTLPILCGLVTMAQQFLSTANMQDSTQKMMLFMMPVMFLIITPQFPAALAVYWLFYGLFSAVQRTWMNWRMHTGFFTPKEEKERIKAAAAEAKAKQARKQDKSRTANNATHATTHNRSAKNDEMIDQNRERRANDHRDKPWH
ncbi:MAG: membrane protein insertase YidC [Firmicutes bacterium]|nr:membrane protein insertase YidC [Bacillota bacterium]